MSSTGPTSYSNRPMGGTDPKYMEGYRKIPSIRHNVERILHHQGFRMAHLARCIGRQQSSLIRTLDGNVTVRVLQTCAWGMGVDPMYFLMQHDKLEQHLACHLIRFSSKPPICKAVLYAKARRPRFSQLGADVETEANDVPYHERVVQHAANAHEVASGLEARYNQVPSAPPSDAGDAQITMRKDAHAYAPPGSGITAEQQMAYASDNNYPGQPAPWNQATDPQTPGAQTDPPDSREPAPQDEAAPVATWEEVEAMSVQTPADDDRIDKSVGAGSAIPFADPSQLEDDIAATAEAERQRYAFDASVGVDHLGTPLDLPVGWQMAPGVTHTYHDYRARGWLWRQMVDHSVVTPENTEH